MGPQPPTYTAGLRGAVPAMPPGSCSFRPLSWGKWDSVGRMELCGPQGTEKIGDTLEEVGGRGVSRGIMVSVEGTPKTLGLGR